MIQKSGKVNHGRETMTVKLDDGEEIDVYFSFYGGGVLPTLTWDGFQAVNEEDLIGLQVHEGGCFRNDPTPPKVGDLWASIYCGQAGHIYVPLETVKIGQEVGKLKIVWIGEYPNEFGYMKNIAIMEMLS